MTAKAAILSKSTIRLEPIAPLSILMCKVSPCSIQLASRVGSCMHGMCMYIKSALLVHCACVCPCLGPPVSLLLEVSGVVVEDDRRMAYVAVETSRVNFSCSFLADPVPNVTWLQNGVLIVTNQPRYSVERKGDIMGRPIKNITDILTIKSVVLEDSGNYTCFVSNMLGSSSPAAEELVVIGQCN